MFLNVKELDWMQKIFIMHSLKIFRTNEKTKIRCYLDGYVPPLGLEIDFTSLHNNEFF